MTKKKKLTSPMRLIKSRKTYGFFSTKYNTRKDFRNKKFSPFAMRSCKGRTKIRRHENKRVRIDKFNLAPHKKIGINYQWSIY